MAIMGISTGSGYNAYNSGGSFGNLRQTKINEVSVNTGAGLSSIGEPAGKVTDAGIKPLENQVAVSKDGDTLQISPDASVKLDEHVKELENKYKSDKNKIDDEIRKKNEDTAKRELVKQAISFAGKSDSDITRLYLEGEITKFDYDSEMSDREKMREQNAKVDNDFIEKTSDEDALEKKTERSGRELQIAFSDEASKTFDAMTRLKTIDAASGENKDRKEVKASHK